MQKKKKNLTAFWFLQFSRLHAESQTLQLSSLVTVHQTNQLPYNSDCLLEDHYKPSKSYIQISDFDSECVYLRISAYWSGLGSHGSSNTVGQQLPLCLTTATWAGAEWSWGSNNRPKTGPVLRQRKITPSDDIQYTEEQHWPLSSLFRPAPPILLLIWRTVAFFIKPKLHHL